MKISVKSRKLIFTFIILLIIYLVRIFSNTPILVGEESYHNLRISEELSKNPVISEDPLGGNYRFSIFPYLLIPISNLGFYLPLFFALITGIFYSLSIDKKYRYLSTALLFLSPIFLELFTQLSNAMFATFLVVANLYFIKSRKIITFTVIQTIIALTSFEIWLLSTIFFSYQYRTYIAVIPGLLLMPFTLIFNPELTPIFSELGANLGYSLFLLLLGFIGVFWKKKEPTKTSLLIFGMMVSLYFPATRILGTLIMVPYASRVIIKLLDRKWELPHIKQVTILLIFLVLAFSGVAKASELSKAEPYDIELYELMEPLPQGIVLSSPENGQYIQYFAKKRILVNDISSKEEKQYTKDLLNSQDSEHVHKELINNDIKYIIVKNTEERRGFQFIADNSENLTILFAGEKELWTFSS